MNSEPRWERRAACRNKDFEQFFVAEYKHETVAELKELCSNCPVKTECLAFADSFEGESYKDTWGIYGGLTARERQARRADMLAQAQAVTCATPGRKRSYERHIRLGNQPCKDCAAWRDRREADAARWERTQQLIAQGHSNKHISLVAGVHWTKVEALRTGSFTASVDA